MNPSSNLRIGRCLPGLLSLALVASLVTTTAGASPLTYLASGTIADITGDAAGSLTSIGTGNTWSLVLTIDPSEPDIAACDPGAGPCDYANGSGTLTIGSTVLGIAASPGGVVELVNDTTTMTGTTDGIAFLLPGDGSLTPTQVDGLFLGGIGLSLEFVAATLADASLAGSLGVTDAAFTGPQQGLLLFLSTEEGGGGDAVYLGATTTSFAVVPVPAAAWLFGSAVGLLGALKRRL
ncbi:MAG: hypothetical protein J0M16_08515 [Gammaproteobacteria bacterium]|nr:hypothetical protein [Gammaproteobacteria bacterium]